MSKNPLLKFFVKEYRKKIARRLFDEANGIVEEISMRTGNTDWCLCEHCESMDSEKESLYRHSVQNLNCILADSNVKCISQHPEWLIY